MFSENQHRTESLFYKREKNREMDKVCIKILMRLHKRFEPHCVLFWPKWPQKLLFTSYNISLSFTKIHSPPNNNLQLEFVFIKSVSLEYIVFQ